MSESDFQRLSTDELASKGLLQSVTFDPEGRASLETTVGSVGEERTVIERLWPTGDRTGASKDAERFMQSLWCEERPPPRLVSPEVRLWSRS